VLNEPPPDVFLNLPPLYATESIPTEETIIQMHFFLGRCDWYVAEFDGEDTFFGYACLGDPDMAEFGYFSLSELKSIKAKTRVIDAQSGALIGMLPVQVEWDENWKPKPFCDVQTKHLASHSTANN
jgi:hypothetical protein